MVKNTRNTSGTQHNQIQSSGSENSIPNLFKSQRMPADSVDPNIAPEREAYESSEDFSHLVDDHLGMHPSKGPLTFRRMKDIAKDIKHTMSVAITNLKIELHNLIERLDDTIRAGNHRDRLLG